MEVITLKHPTSFHINYMNGEVHITERDGSKLSKQIQQTADEETFNPYLEGLHINNNTITVAVMLSMHCCLIYSIS